MSITLNAEQLWKALPEHEKQRIVREQIKGETIVLVRKLLPELVVKCLSEHQPRIDEQIRQEIYSKQTVRGLVHSGLAKQVGDAVRGALKRSEINVHINVADTI